MCKIPKLTCLQISVAFFTSFSLISKNRMVENTFVSYRKKPKGTETKQRSSGFMTFGIWVLMLAALLLALPSNGFLFGALLNGPRQANLVLIAYASSEGSGEPAHPRSLARTFATRLYKQLVKRNLQTESQIPGPSECLGRGSKNLSWRNARRHKFAWRGSNDQRYWSKIHVIE